MSKDIIKKYSTKPLVWLLSVQSSITFLLSSAFAGNMGPLPTENINAIAYEFGTRYWLSTGHYDKKLYEPNGHAMVSRLNYRELQGDSAEAFWKIAPENGLLFKGYFGGGSISRGKMTDEDFLPYTDPYSNTYQAQRFGNITFFNIDVGYQLSNYFLPDDFQNKLYFIVGYQTVNERLNTFGCTQLAGSSICGDQNPPSSSVIPSVDILDNHAILRSLRLGLNDRHQFNERFLIDADIVFIHSYLSARDYHNMRPDIRGIIEEGRGNGIQAEGLVKWQPTPSVQFGLGGRIWYVPIRGYSHSEQTASLPNTGPSPVEMDYNRYGLLVEANYLFDTGLTYNQPSHTLGAVNSCVKDWSGLYAGVNIGYGISPSHVWFHQLSQITFLPRNLDITRSGFVGGGQIGYNVRPANWLLGVEAEWDGSNLSGSKAVTTQLYDFAAQQTVEYITTTTTQLNWMANVRARVGAVPSEDLLVYLTAGPAFGDARLSYDQRIPVFACANSSICATGAETKQKTGWVAGGGFEFAMTDQLSMKAEYLYQDLGKLSALAVDTGTSGEYSAVASTRLNFYLIRMGVNYQLF